MTKDRS